jgi:hypothetical protein
VNQYKFGLAALLLVAVAAAPCAEQQGSINVEAPPHEASCTGACFAYLEFPPSFDAEVPGFEGAPAVVARDSQVAATAAPTLLASKE